VRQARRRRGRTARRISTAFEIQPASGFGSVPVFSCLWHRARAVDAHLIKLDQEHPGFRDPDYRVRRDAIARLALAHQRGEPPPQVAYNPDEQKVWSGVLDALAPLHARCACRSFRDAWPQLGFTGSRIPQLSEVSATLQRLTGFTYEPVAGLMSAREFMERLASRTFLATQYMRHPSAPLYTPEPDVIHELVGHAPSLSDERYARINALFGEATAATALTDHATVEQLIRTYWFCLEFGLVREGGAVKAVGAGLLSSFGELGRFERESTLLPFDLERIAQTPFDPTQYQGTLFVAPSEEALLSSLTGWLEGLASG
jgi:phenylalanine-4-hydroxylase